METPTPTPTPTPAPETKLTRQQRMTAAFALRALAGAFSSEDRPDDFIREVVSSKRYMDEFIQSVNKVPELTEDEAEVSASVHTWLRKCCDTPYGTILYACIHENRGLLVWVAFIKKLHKMAVASKMKMTQRDFNAAIYEAKRAHHVMEGTTEDLITYCCIQMLADDWKSICDWLKE